MSRRDMAQRATTIESYSQAGVDHRLGDGDEFVEPQLSEEPFDAILGHLSPEKHNPGAGSACLCRACRLRNIDFVGWKRLAADDYFLCRKPNWHKLRRNQHTELGDDSSDEHRHHAGDIHVHVCEWFHEREPNRNDHLHADCDQCRRLDHSNGHRYHKRCNQTHHQLLQRQSDKHYFGCQQHTKLGDDRSDEHRYHTGDIYFHVCEWGHECEPDGNDYLHADGDQCLRLDHRNGTSRCNHGRRDIIDSDHLMSRRDTRCGLRGLHNCSQRRFPAVHLFRKHEFRLSSVAGGDVS